jgi:hypothetical protein
MTISKREPQEPIGTLGTLGEFWQWAMSDMLNNRNRGILAEFIVGKLLGLELKQPRIEWDSHDLVYQGFKIEVKSSGYIQSWHQADQPSKIGFGISKRFGWDAVTNTSITTADRVAHLYVFCVFPFKPTASTRATASDDVLKPDLWAFYAAQTSQLPDAAKTLSLSQVEQICGSPVPYTALKLTVDRLLGLTGHA